MANQKKNKAPMQKVAVSTPAQAVALFKEFRKNSGMAPVQIPGSRAKYYTAQQMVEWYATQGKIIHSGWLGRALHAAANSGMQVSISETEIGEKPVNVYRGSAA